MAKALEGIRILDFTQYEAGTSCTEFLAFLGADVIKIEPPGRGDPGRSMLLSPDERAKGLDAWYYTFLNANKRSITLNLRSEKGVAMFKEMVKQADAVISNFTPGTMDNLGIGYAVLSKINPRLVYAENSGFGQGGPYANYPSFDPIAKAIGGSFSFCGLADTPPLNPGMSVGDTGAGIHTAGGVLAAIIYAMKTGEGQFVDSSMADNIVNMMRVPIAINTFSMFPGKPAPRPQAIDVIKCKGGGPNDYIYLLFLTPQQYENMAKVIGREDLLELDYKGNFWAVRTDPKVTKAVEDWCLTQNKIDAFHVMAKAGVPAAPVLDTVEVLNDPHFNERGMIVEIEHPLRGKFKMPGCPVKLSKSPVDYSPAPALGQDNEEVFAELLNLTPEAVARLKEEKVV